ncbi:MAG TPA: M50 family metallopeptidase, partial [Candidatus Elarobacter sp.]
RSFGKPIQVVYQRAGHDHSVNVTPVAAADGKAVGHLGFQPLPAMERVGVGEAFSYSWAQFSNVITRTAGVLGALVTHPSTVAGQVQGPIGMARVSAQAQEFGPYMFLSLAAMISISLGIFNFLPLPALDGGRGVFILVEMVRGRPVDPEKEALVHVGGFAVLIALMIAVSYHDVVSMLSGKTAF